MLFSQSFSRLLASIALCTLCAPSLPAYAAVSVLQNENILEASKAAQLVLKDPSSTSITQMDKESLLACGTCGCEASTVAAIEGTTVGHRDSSLLTDSLWGNLILEMAYQRDKKIEKLAKKLGIVNMATMAAVLGIAGGSIGQGIAALATLNPSEGHLDSYAPGIVGVSIGSATLMTFAARIYFSRKYGKQLKTRQLAIKGQIEEILNHLEYSQAKCPDVHKELAELIGERATGEFLQLWQSSHQLASNPNNSISMLKQMNVNSSLIAAPH